MHRGLCWCRGHGQCRSLSWPARRGPGVTEFYSFGHREVTVSLSGDGSSNSSRLRPARPTRSVSQRLATWSPPAAATTRGGGAWVNLSWLSSIRIILTMTGTRSFEGLAGFDHGRCCPGQPDRANWTRPMTAPARAFFYCIQPSNAQRLRAAEVDSLT